MRRFVAFALVLWAAGVVLHEAIEQAAAGFVILAAIVAWRRGVRVDEDVRPVLRATAWLAGFLAISPAIAWGRGLVAGWPPSEKYGQLEDVVSVAALAVVVRVGVPWRAISWTIGVGWLASFALGLWQHLRWFRYNLSWLTGQPEWRVHQSLDGKHWTAGGFLFHRLRFAHTALALVGPASSVSIVGSPLVARISAILLGGILLGSAYIAYARTALVAMLVVAGVGLFWLAGRRTRIAGLVVLTGLGVAVFVTGPIQALVVKALGSFDHDRGAAMQLAWEIGLAHPLVGVGFGNFQAFATPLAPAGSTWVVSHSAHNTWLQVFAEAGLVGLALTVWFHVALVRALWNRRRDVVAAGALLSWVGFQLVSLVHTLPGASGVMLAFVFVWGLGLAPVEDPKAE